MLFKAQSKSDSLSFYMISGSCRYLVACSCGI
jgi:hypothetical protein